MLKVFCAEKQDVKILVAKVLKVENLTFEFNAYGKPLIANIDKIYFNGTHTKKKHLLPSLM